MFTFFTDTWADAVQRGYCFTIDRCILEAIKDPRVSTLLVANPFRSAPIAVVRRLQGRQSPPLPPSNTASGLYQPLRVRRQDPTDAKHVRDVYVDYDNKLRNAAAGMGLHRPTVISANPLAVAHCRFEWAAEVTYYGYDDWSALPALAPWWPAISDAYDRIASRQRRVAAVSQSILERIDPNGPAVVIPNGIEPTEWEPPWKIPAFATGLPSPMVLYVGSLGERLDISMVEATAERIQTGEVVLVGPVGDPAVVSHLSRIPRVRIERNVGRRHVAGLIHAADVCIMPHRESDLTVSMSPLKLYEYLAGGRPVVATDLPPVRDVHHSVIRVQPGDAQGFAEAVEETLSTPAVSEADRLDFIAANSWSARFNELLTFATGNADNSTTGDIDTP